MKKYSERRWQILNRVIGWADDVSWVRVRRLTGCAIHHNSGPIEDALAPAFRSIPSISTNFKSQVRSGFILHARSK